MNFRISLPTTLILGLLVSIIPLQFHASEPDVKKILLYGGTFIAGIGVLNVAQNKPKAGLSLVAIGAGMAAVAKPAQTERILSNLLNSLMGKSKAERVLDETQHNWHSIRSWWLNWVNS